MLAVGGRTARTLKGDNVSDNIQAEVIPVTDEELRELAEEEANAELLSENEAGVAYGDWPDVHG
jgi:hypothetical protein